MFDTATKQNRNSLETALDASVAHVYNFLKYSSNILSRKTWPFRFKARDEREQKEERRNSSYFNQTGKEKSLQLTTVISTGSYDDYLCRVTWNLTPFPAF